MNPDRAHTRTQHRTLRILDGLGTRSLHSPCLAGHRLHLVSHRSIWEDEEDERGPMSYRHRLEEELLEPLGFCSVINGHSHGPMMGPCRTGATRMEVLRISVPTLSTQTRPKGREEPRGFVRWRIREGKEPELVEVGGPFRGVETGDEGQGSSG